MTRVANGVMADWARSLGEKHGARARTAALAGRARRERAAEMLEACQDQWTSVVAAIRSLVATYNAGFERDVLQVIEERPGVVKIQTGDEAGPSLLAALEDSRIAVRWIDSQGVACDTEQPLRPERSPHDTAAYLLQNWMARL